MDAFHKHLDGCKRCADHPFDLCATGARLLLLAVHGVFSGPGPLALRPARQVGRWLS